MRQNPPIKPARATTRIKIPKIMTGHCRSLTQELSASVASQIPAPMTGIERSTATKLMAPITLLLSAIFCRELARDRSVYRSFRVIICLLLL